MKSNKNIVCLFLMLVVFIACKTNPKKENDKAITPSKPIIEVVEKKKAVEKNKLNIIYKEDKQVLKAYYELPHIKEFYDWQDMTYSQQPNLDCPSDLSTLSYEDLRLLRNEIFARNGYLFKDGYLRGYFNRFKWYMPIFDVDTFKVNLNKEEKNLINKILLEEAKRKEYLTVEKENLALLNSDLIANAKQFTSIPVKVQKDFQNQNFSLVDANRAMPFFIYDKNAYQYIPHYITTDLYLFILHKYFSRFLERLDEYYMYEQLKGILNSTSSQLNQISNPSIESSVEWAQMYNSLALYALGDSLVNAPDKYAELFEKEKKNIASQSGNPLFLENQFVDYSELKPRGHYTKSKELKMYFKGFKWISLNGIDLDNDEQLKGLILFAYTIKNDEKLLKQYKQYISVVEKLAGREDNLSLSDVINSIKARSIDEVLSDTEIENVKRELNQLNKEKIKLVLGESFRSEKSVPKRLYFLSSTYSLSGDIFSKLVHIDRENSKRPFPRGLDIPAVFGNTTAQKILTDEYKDGEAWSDFIPKLSKLQNQFKDFNDWNHNYGFKSVQTALASCSELSYYPAFMKTDAYNRKELSTTLSSWTHIKHDLILYQGKPHGAECGQGGGPEPPQHYSYVEPNIEFWDSALELVDWLKRLSKYQPTYDDELRRIKELGDLLRTVANKEIDGKEISKEEYRELHYVGGTVEYILLGLLESDHLPARESSMALIADVYAYNGKNLNVAVGHADDIYTIVPIKGEYYIARGSVFSYYEFKGEILDDEQWRAKIRSYDIPKRPEWMKPIVNKVTPIQGQMQFRYSGHGLY